MARENICERICSKRISFGEGNYFSGKKYCRRCEVYLYHSGLFRLCCGMQLRLTPSSRECKEMLEYRKGHVALHPRHDKLITALRTTVENGEGVLNKEASSQDDCFDAFGLSLQFWH
jgi:hypothetical protein